MKDVDVITNTGMNQRQSGWNPDILRSLKLTLRKPQSGSVVLIFLGKRSVVLRDRENSGLYVQMQLEHLPATIAQ